MKPRIFHFMAPVLLILLMLVGCARENECEEFAPTDIQIVDQDAMYDSIRAKKLGADDYGMKQYVMVMLREGPTRNHSKKETENIQKAHLASISKLADEGVLVLAGPFLKEGDLKGIFLFDVRTIEEAEALTQLDPAVKAGRLIMELHEWYGSAAIMELNEIHKLIAKINI